MGTPAQVLSALAFLAAIAGLILFVGSRGNQVERIQAPSEYAKRIASCRDRIDASGRWTGKEKEKIIAICKAFEASKEDQP